MVQIPSKERIFHYIDSIMSYPVQVIPVVTKEAARVVAATLFLEIAGQKYLVDQNPKVSQKEIYNTTVIAPLVEEILFRGVLLNGIRLLQKGWNYLTFADKLTDEDRKVEQIFRVHLSALIFATLHLFNPHKHIAGALIQFTWSYLGGMTYAYLSEKYHTLSVNILVHGINNTLAVAGAVHGDYAPICLLAIFTNKIFAYTIAVTSIDEKICAGLSATGQYCADLSGRLAAWVVPVATPVA